MVVEQWSIYSVVCPSSSQSTASATAPMTASIHRQRRHLLESATNSAADWVEVPEEATRRGGTKYHDAVDGWRRHGSSNSVHVQPNT